MNNLCPGEIFSHPTPMTKTACFSTIPTVHAKEYAIYFIYSYKFTRLYQILIITTLHSPLSSSHFRSIAITIGLGPGQVKYLKYLNVSNVSRNI